MKKTAIVIFAFNRPDHLSATLDYLSRSKKAFELPLIFFIDGPRNDAEKKAVEDVVNLAEKFIHPLKQIYCQKSNYGLKKSVITGINVVFETFDQAIILEDDICINQEFINFHLKCLEMYYERNDIWSISGFVIPEIGYKANKITSEELVLAPRASSWGWSTWKYKWNQANWDSKFIANSLKFNYKDYSRTGGDKLRMLLREIEGKSNSWAIIWDYNHFINKAYCVYPVKPLIKNIGLDNSGTHSKPKKAYEVILDEGYITSKFLKDIKPNESIMKLFSKINRKLHRFPLDFFNLLKFKITRI